MRNAPPIRTAPTRGRSHDHRGLRRLRTATGRGLRIGSVATVLVLAASTAASAQEVEDGGGVPPYNQLVWSWLWVVVVAAVVTGVAIVSSRFVQERRQRARRAAAEDEYRSLLSAITDLRLAFPDGIDGEIDGIDGGIEGISGGIEGISGGIEGISGGIEGIDDGVHERDHDGVSPGEPRARIWPTAVGLVVVAAVALLATHHGWYGSDNRFLWYWNPTRALAQSMTAWDGQVNLGGPPGGQGQLFVMSLGIMRSLGLAPWLVERLSQAGLLAAGAVGVALVVREFSPRARIAPVVAGLWWLASPYSLEYLIPSALYLNAALCPWMILALIRGTTTAARWRWAAIFTVLVAIAGWLNPPALAWAALPMLPTAAYLLLTGRTTFRALVRWGVITGGLLFLILLPAVVRSALTAENLTRNLALSETAEAVSLSSSWSESIRGLGFWLTYWNPSGPLAHPYVNELLRSWPLVVLTFVPVLIAFAMVAFSKARGRLLFGSIALVATAAMVGGFPVGAQTAYGRLLFAMFEAVPATFALRNSYKAGAGLLVATAALLGLAVEWFYHWSRRRQILHIGGLALVGLVIVGSAFPLWSGALYEGTSGNNGIPQYWYDAATWANEQPGAGRVLVVPATETPVYRWGAAPQGDLFTSLLDRPFVLDQVLSNTSPDTGNLINALSLDLGSRSYEPGAIGPIARRLGISYVLIRNDLDWRRAGLVRPVELDPLRQDPDLQLVRSFGEPGENVVAPGAVELGDQIEQGFPPVQIYEVAGATEPIRTVSAAPSLVLSGDGSAWPGLARDGSLSSLGPVRYSARLDADELTTELEAGAPVVITDTNRRARVGFSLTKGPTVSEASTGAIDDLFGVPGSQTVLAFPDARSIESTGVPNLVSPGAGHPPAAAFYGDPASSWLTGGLLPLTNQGLQVRLKGERPISGISLSPALGLGTRRVVSVRIEFPDGSSEDVSMGSGPTSVTFGTHVADAFTIRVTGLLGVGTGFFGLSNISVPGLDLTPSLQLPDDVFRSTADDAAGRAALLTAPLSYRFQRAVGSDGEPVMRRTFEVAGSRRFEAAGSISLAPTATDAQLTSLLGTQSTAIATTRYLDNVNSSGALAVDGNTDTAWMIDGDTVGQVAVTFPIRLLTSLDVTVDVGAEVTAPTQLTVAVGPGFAIAPVPPPPETCEAQGPCLVTVRIPIGQVAAATLKMQVSPGASTPLPGEPAPRPARIVEIATNGVPNPPVVDLPATCHPDLVTVDGSSVGLQLDGTETDLLAGAAVSMSACSAVSIGEGPHDLVGARWAPVESLVLRATDGRAAIPAEAVPTTVTSRSNADASMSVDAEPGAQVVLGTAYSKDWKASAQGGSLGAPVELDTQTAFVLSSSGPTDVEATYGPEGLYKIFVWVSIAAFGLTIVLAVADPFSRPQRRAGAWSTRATRWRLPLDVGTVVFCYLVAGVIPALLAVGVIVAVRQRWVRPRLVSIVAVALMAAAVVMSVPPLGPALVPLNPTWVINRPWAHHLAQLAAVMLAVVIDVATVRWATGRPHEVEPERVLAEVLDV